MSSVTNDLEGPLGPCPDRTELFQFSLDRERLVPHVSRCPACRSILLEASHDAAVFAKPGDRETAEMEEDWQRLKRKALEISQPQNARQEAAWTWRGRTPWPGGAETNKVLSARKFAFVTATLLMAAGLGLFLARSWKKPGAAELAAQKEILQQNQQLRNKLAQMQLSTATPQINFSANDVYPTTALVRGEKLSVLTIRFTPDAPSLLLLNATGQDTYSGYDVEIVDAQDRVVWQSQGLQRDDVQHSYHILLPAGFLTPGTYLIRIFGKNEHARRRITDYRIRIVDQRDSPTTEKAAQK